MTGIKFLNFIADIFGVGSREKKRTHSKNMPTPFELTDSLSMPVASYSHGMKQKACRHFGFDTRTQKAQTDGRDPLWDVLDPKSPPPAYAGICRRVCDNGECDFLFHPRS